MAGSTGLEPAASAVTGQRSNQLNYDPAIGCSGLAETLINTGDSTYSTVSPVSSISTKYHHLMSYGLYANPPRLVRPRRNICLNRTPLIVTDCAQTPEIRHLPCGCSKRMSPHNCNQALLCPPVAAPFVLGRCASAWRSKCARCAKSNSPRTLNLRDLVVDAWTVLARLKRLQAAADRMRYWKHPTAACTVV